MTFVDFVLGIGGNLLAGRIQPFFDSITRLPVPSRLAAHRRELGQKLRSMPFIYRDLDLDVLNDFVELNWVVRSTSHSVNVDWERAEPLLPMSQGGRRFQDHRRLFLVGDAGAGKTTTVRYAIQSCIRDMRGAGLSISGARRLVPLYVPLKSVDHSAPSPIVRYLLRSCTLLAGKGGMKRLLRYARSGRIFLLLDGYDEVPLVGDSPFIREELDAIFGDVNVIEDSGFDASFRELYRGLQGCRVWLSSRPIFLRDRPIRIVAQVGIFGALGLRGQKVRLVNRIFERYRARSPFFAERLNDELFLQQMLTAGGPEFAALLDNPLFLTVLCYLYASALPHAPDGQPQLKNSVYGLIGQCVELLLRDIDEYKTRGLRPAERAALLGRRSTHFSEKQEFLRYFAAQLYVRGLGAFNERDLAAEASAYCERHPSFGSIEARRAIADSGPHGFVRQLVYSGVFVVVDSTPTERTYDFPHRTFREVLACDYFIDGKSDELLGFLSVPRFGELILRYLERIPAHAELVRRLIRLYVSERGSSYSTAMLGSALKSCRVDREVRDDLGRFLVERVTTDWLGPIPAAVERLACVDATGQSTMLDTMASLLGAWAPYRLGGADPQFGPSRVGGEFGPASRVLLAGLVLRRRLPAQLTALIQSGLQAVAKGSLLEAVLFELACDVCRDWALDWLRDIGETQGADGSYSRQFSNAVFIALGKTAGTEGLVGRARTLEAVLGARGNFALKQWVSRHGGAPADGAGGAERIRRGTRGTFPAPDLPKVFSDA